MKHFLPLILSLFYLELALAADDSDDIYDWENLTNYSELRQEIGWSDNYDARCFFSRPLAEMAKAMNEENWEGAIKLGESWLNQCPIDIRAHYYTGIALGEIGREVESENHFRWSRGLMEDLVASGDGKSCETAYITISVSEEYDALYFFRLQKQNQSLVRAENASCDLITAKNDEEKEFSIYFNPEAHFARLAKLLDKVNP